MKSTQTFLAPKPSVRTDMVIHGYAHLSAKFRLLSQTTVQATKPNVWDQIDQALTKVVVPAANVTTQIIAANKGQQSGSTVPSYTPQPYPTPGAPLPVVAQDNTKKYLMIGGAIVLAGATLYLVTRKKGKGK